jgi:peptidoglycan/LPS O-acetylase OafA/YrhL
VNEATAGAKPSYRPDIDGLRAVAVASVVAYHYFPRTAHGGFIGVDVFFVISGFLITSLLAKEIAGGGIAFVDFYARRIRRIFPALALVLAFALIAGTVLLTPEAYRALGLEAAAGAASTANLLFWAQSGYFDAASGAKPLLHLWSLAVEEQFYLLWPLALALAARARAPLAAFAAAVGLVSFALNLYWTARWPAASFYFVGTRLWELAMGGTLALATEGGAKVPTGRTAQAAALAGAACLLVGLLTLNAEQPFPGWRALWPTVGATLLIGAGPLPFVNRAVLAAPLMVRIGEISYPLYLWHWPLLVFTRVRNAGGASAIIRWLLIVLAVALAHWTYTRIEKPIRFGPAKARKTAAAFAALAALGAVGFVDSQRGGLMFPGASFIRVVHSGEIGSDAFVAAVKKATRPCPARFQPQEDGRDFSEASCVETKPGAPEIALIGDSHAHQALLGLAEALPQRNIAFFGGATLHLFAVPANRKVFAALAAEPALKTALFAARWSDRRRRYADKALFVSEIRDAVAIFQAAGKRVYLLLDTPSFRFPPTLCKYYEPIVYQTRCEAPRGDHERVKAESLSDVRAIAAALPGVTIWDPTPYFCDARTCSMALGDKLLFRDENHLSANGSRYEAERLLADLPELRDNPSAKAGAAEGEPVAPRAGGASDE